MPRPSQHSKGPPALASRPLPEAHGGPILPHAPPVTVAPRLRALYQSRVLARVLPDYPHLHAFSMEDLAKEWNVPVPALAARLTGRVEVSGQDLLFMADELGCTPHELLAGILAYLPAAERARLRERSRLAGEARYSKIRKTDRPPRPRAPEGYTPLGARRPVQTEVLARLPPSERSPLPTPAPLEVPVTITLMDGSKMYTGIHNGAPQDPTPPPARRKGGARGKA